MLVNDALAAQRDDLAPGESNIWMCNTCRKAWDNGKAHYLAVFNDLMLDPVPPELAELNYMELRLVTPVHTFAAMLTLPLGQRGNKGQAISFPFSVPKLVHALPRPPDDVGIVTVQMPSKQTAAAARHQPQRPQQQQERQGDNDDDMHGTRPELDPMDPDARPTQQPSPTPPTPAPQVVQPPPQYAIRYHMVMRAIVWLHANNTLIASMTALEEWPVHVQQELLAVQEEARIRAEAAAVADGDEDMPDDAVDIDLAGLNHLQHTVVLEAGVCWGNNMCKGCMLYICICSQYVHACIHCVTLCVRHNTPYAEALNVCPPCPTCVLAEPGLPGGVLEDIVMHSGQQVQAIQRHLVYKLQKLDGQPISIHTQSAIEALAFPRLYPYGRNHWGTHREQPVKSMAMYFRSRLMGADPRFKEPMYMIWAVSVMHYMQLYDAVSVCLRMQVGPVTLTVLRQQLQPQQQQQPLGLTQAPIDQQPRVDVGARPQAAIQVGMVCKWVGGFHPECLPLGIVSVPSCCL